MTDAECAKRDFNYATKTISIVAIAKHLNATKDRYRDAQRGLSATRYTFPDGSCLMTSGRGISHRIWLND